MTPDQLRKLLGLATQPFAKSRTAMTGESLLQMGDIYVGGRSVQLRTCDVDLIVALVAHTPALLRIVDATKELCDCRELDGVYYLKNVRNALDQLEKE